MEYMQRLTEREWKEGKERKRKERGGEWNLGRVCVIGFRGIDAPGWRELQLVFVHPHFIRCVIVAEESWRISCRDWH